VAKEKMEAMNLIGKKAIYRNRFMKDKTKTIGITITELEAYNERPGFTGRGVLDNGKVVAFDFDKEIISVSN